MYAHARIKLPSRYSTAGCCDCFCCYRPIVNSFPASIRLSTGLNIAQLCHDDEETGDQTNPKKVKKDSAEGAGGQSAKKAAAPDGGVGDVNKDKITLTRQATDANRNLTGIEVRESGAISSDVIKLYFNVRHLVRVYCLTSASIIYCCLVGSPEGFVSPDCCSYLATDMTT